MTYFHAAPRDFMDHEATAAYFGASLDAVNRWAQSDQSPAGEHQGGPGWRKSVLDAWIADGKPGPG